MRKIILASASPRRRELLAAAGVIFQICAAEGEEKITAERPDEIVCELSAQKAEEIASKFELGDGTVIARLLRRITMKSSHRSSVSVHLKIPLIISIKTVSDEVMATSSCRLWQVIPDGNLSM